MNGLVSKKQDLHNVCCVPDELDDNKPIYKEEKTGRFKKLNKGRGFLTLDLKGQVFMTSELPI